MSERDSRGFKDLELAKGEIRSHPMNPNQFLYRDDIGTVWHQSIEWKSLRERQVRGEISVHEFNLIRDEVTNLRISLRNAISDIMSAEQRERVARKRLKNLGYEETTN